MVVRRIIQGKRCGLLESRNMCRPLEKGQAERLGIDCLEEADFYRTAGRLLEDHGKTIHADKTLTAT